MGRGIQIQQRCFLSRIGEFLVSVLLCASYKPHGTSCLLQETVSISVIRHSFEWLREAPSRMGNTHS